jgi:hypothetical protein
MKPSGKIIGRIVISLALTISFYFVFKDGISYLLEKQQSQIVSLDFSTLKFLKDETFDFGGPGINRKEVSIYTTHEGKKIAIYKPFRNNDQKLFIRGWYNEYNNIGYEKFVTYRPFIIWEYVLERACVFLILSFIIFLVGGLFLKIFSCQPSKSTI